jgi:hypothetical protein
MPSSSTARRGTGTAGTGTATRKGQVPRQRGQQLRPAQQQDAAEQRGMSMSAPRIHLPGGTAGNVIWWGGLGTVAALGIVDWPVVALVAAGTWVAEQHSRQSGHTRAAD